VIITVGQVNTVNVELVYNAEHIRETSLPLLFGNQPIEIESELTTRQNRAKLGQTWLCDWSCDNCVNRLRYREEMVTILHLQKLFHISCRAIGPLPSMSADRLETGNTIRQAILFPFFR
jgi:hypothetical protein